MTETKTGDVLISEVEKQYTKRLNDFRTRLETLEKRSETLHNYLWAKAYWNGVFLASEEGMPEGDYQPKRGKKEKELVLPVKFFQYTLALSHRQALAFHLASRLDVEIEELCKLGYFAATEQLKRAEQILKEAVSHG